MKKLAFLLWVILLFGFNHAYFSKSLIGSETQGLAKKTEPIILNEQILKGFEKCEYSKKFEKIRSKAIKENQPIAIDEKGSTITYKAQGTFYGLPIEAIEIGVCDFNFDEEYSLSCGWAYYTALIISKPFSEVKKFLKKATGKDFTKESTMKNYLFHKDGEGHG